MSRPISAAFGRGSGRARGTLKTQTGGLENPDGWSRRAQAELGAEECTRRRRSSDIDALLTVPITGRVKVVESRCGAVAVGRTYLLPPLSFGGAYWLGRGSVFTSTGSPEAVTRPRFPQNVACGFPAPTLFGSWFTALRAPAAPSMGGAV